MCADRIVFYDSGVGGITVMKEFLRRYPSARCAYYGDNENAPYGNLAEGEIRRLADNIFEKIARLSPRAAVIACNTVTAECADVLRKKYSFPIVGVEPAVKPAAAAGGRVLLLATRATLASMRVRRLIAKYGEHAKIVPYCPLSLAGDVEKHIFDLSAIRIEEHLPAGQYSAVVLGCTHYIYLRKVIEIYYRCPVFDGNVGTADHLAKVVNICSENCQKLTKNSPVFLGSAAALNENVYNSMK